MCAGLTEKGILWARTSNEQANWHPLTWLSLEIDAQLFGLRSWGFHLTNLLLHAANIVLLFAVLRTMTGALWQSAWWRLSSAFIRCTWKASPGRRNGRMS